VEEGIQNMSLNREVYLLEIVNSNRKAEAMKNRKVKNNKAKNDHHRDP